MMAVLDGKEPTVEQIKRAIRKARLRFRVLPGSVRFRLQEQGRAAAAGCHR
jgi:hypothetical protein